MALTTLQRAYVLGFRRGCARARKEMRAEMQRDMADRAAAMDAELASLADEIAEIKVEYHRARAIAAASSVYVQRDPDATLH